MPNGTYGGVRGRGLITPSYSISTVAEVIVTMLAGEGMITSLM
ncbi:MAG: hypothetical protein AB9903_00225 [Vulcanimicrobiota bacterium]